MTTNRQAPASLRMGVVTDDRSREAKPGDPNWPIRPQRKSGRGIVVQKPGTQETDPERRAAIERDHDQLRQMGIRGKAWMILGRVDARLRELEGQYGVSSEEVVELRRSLDTQDTATQEWLLSFEDDFKEWKALISKRASVVTRLNKGQSIDDIE